MKQVKDNFRDFIPKIEKVIGYTFRDKSLITQAFTRTSYCNENRGAGGVRLQSNEVLEFFGDGVLSVAIITHLMKSYTERYGYGIKTELGEGDFSNIKSKLSDKKNLSECILRLGLQAYLRMGEGDTKLGIATEPSVMEDLFESIVGAVYIDSQMNLEAVIGVVSRMLDVSAYTADAPPIQSSKNALQEWCADKKRRLGQPLYKTLGEEGPDHKKTYERGVFLGERMIASGKGKNLKLADAAAADAALKVLRKEAEVKAQIEQRPQREERTAEPKRQTPNAESSGKKQSAAAQGEGSAAAKKAKEKSAQLTSGKNGGKAESGRSAKGNSKRDDIQPPTPNPSRLDDAIARLTTTALPTTLSEKAYRNEQKRKRKAESVTESRSKPTATVSDKAATPTVKSGKKQTMVDNASGSAESKKALKPVKNATRPTASATAEAKKPQKATKNTAHPTASASAELKRLALAKKAATPTFKDLGEIKNGSRTECRVECICMGESATGTGASRPEAKENAAAIILARLSGRPKKKK